MIFCIKVFIHQVLRYLKWLVWFKDFARLKAENLNEYSHVLFQVSSKLIKKLDGVDPVLQENKVISLKLAVSKLDRIVIRPGEIFSFYYLVGRPSRSKGYPDGLEIQQGKMIESPGGGLCQISNLVHWACINVGLEIVERHRHRFDLFPDDHRSVPFGTGATVFYNYLDLRVKNNLAQDIVFDFEFSDEDLELTIRSSQPLPYDISVREEGHRFYQLDGKRFRTNKIVQTFLYADNSKKKVIALHNDCEVKY